MSSQEPLTENQLPASEGVDLQTVLSLRQPHRHPSPLHSSMCSILSLSFSQDSGHPFIAPRIASTPVISFLFLLKVNLQNKTSSQWKQLKAP